MKFAFLVFIGSLLEFVLLDTWSDAKQTYERESYSIFLRGKAF